MITPCNDSNFRYTLSLDKDYIVSRNDLDAIAIHLKNGHKIPAIRALRIATGCDLRTAKETIDNNPDFQRLVTLWSSHSPHINYNAVSRGEHANKG